MSAFAYAGRWVFTVVFGLTLALLFVLVTLAATALCGVCLFKNGSRK